MDQDTGLYISPNVTLNPIPSSSSLLSSYFRKFRSSPTTPLWYCLIRIDEVIFLGSSTRHCLELLIGLKVVIPSTLRTAVMGSSNSDTIVQETGDTLFVPKVVGLPVVVARWDFRSRPSGEEHAADRPW